MIVELRSEYGAVILVYLEAPATVTVSFPGRFEWNLPKSFSIPMYTSCRRHLKSSSNALYDSSGDCFFLQGFWRL